MTALLLASLFAAAGPDCSLLLGTDHVRGRGVLELAGLTAYADIRTRYVMRWKGAEVSAQSFGDPLLMSITWKPLGLSEPATMTCTQKRGGPVPTSKRTPLAFCVVDDERSVWGEGTVRLELGAVKLTVRATTNELRMAATGSGLGFLAAWREQRPEQPVPLMLRTGTHSVLCTVL